jgi:hypothetical protein
LETCVLQYEVYGVSAPKVLYSLHSPISSQLHAINDLDAYIASEHAATRRYRQSHAWHRFSSDKGLPGSLQKAPATSHGITPAPLEEASASSLRAASAPVNSPPGTGGSTLPEGRLRSTGNAHDHMVLSSSSVAPAETGYGDRRGARSQALSPVRVAQQGEGTLHEGKGKRAAKQGRQKSRPEAAPGRNGLPKLHVAIAEVYAAVEAGDDGASATLLASLLQVFVVRNHALSLAGIEQVLQAVQQLPANLQVRPDVAQQCCMPICMQSPVFQ